MAVLQVLKGLTPGTQFPLVSERAVLGRHPDCDIVLDVGAVSRQHAQIVQVQGEYFVEDLKSRNGTFVNGQAIRDRHKLEDNDRLKICDVLLTFHLEDPSRKPAARVTETALAMMVDDAGAPGGSTIMSTLDVKSSSAGARVTAVNAETKLKALLEISRNLGSAISLEQVLPKILDSLFKIFLQADRGFVVLQEREGGPLIPKAVKHRREDADETIRISRTIVNQAMASKEAILSADAATDSRFDTSQSIADFRIRSMMCVPLVDSEGRALGIIQIDTLDQRTPFKPDDLEVLASVASQAAVAVENAQLHETALRKLALERDLQLGHKVQQGFLPSAPPELTGYEFFAFYEPANQVGGDYFDYVHLPDQRLAVVVADVSGKGIPAALLMAKLSAETRFSLVTERGLAQAVNRLNAGFSGPGWEDRFVTLAVAVIDLREHRLTIVNAGHMAPYLRHADGRVEAVGEEQAGMPLGVSEDVRYEQFSMNLSPGQCLAIFTDGISEAMNVNNDLYGLVRLQNQLRCQARGVRELGELILGDVKQFVGKRAQSDDMCLICFGRNRA